jgi:hypothetical protein
MGLWGPGKGVLWFGKNWVGECSVIGGGDEFADDYHENGR